MPVVYNHLVNNKIQKAFQAPDRTGLIVKILFSSGDRIRERPPSLRRRAAVILGGNADDFFENAAEIIGVVET